MKTTHLLTGTSLIFFLSEKITAQSSLDGKEIILPDQQSLIEWLSADGIFTLFLVISLVSVLIWAFYLLGTLMISIDKGGGNNLSRSRPSHSLPKLSLPRVELENMGGHSRFNSGLMAANSKRKSKDAPDSKRDHTGKGDATRG